MRKLAEKTSPISFRIPAAGREQLDQLADLYQCTPASVLRRLIDEAHTRELVRIKQLERLRAALSRKKKP